MVDVVVLSAKIKMALHDVSKQALMLGQGLQNAVPGGRPTPSIHYLMEMAEYLKSQAESFDPSQSHDNK